MTRKRPKEFSSVEHEAALSLNRRHFLSKLSTGLGSLALGSLLPGCGVGESGGLSSIVNEGVLGTTHLAPKAKRVIYLFQSGSPSQMDLFDHKPLMRELHTQELPDSVRQGQRLTGMTAYQKTLPIATLPSAGCTVTSDKVRLLAPPAPLALRRRVSFKSGTYGDGPGRHATCLKRGHLAKSRTT